MKEEKWRDCWWIDLAKRGSAAKSKTNPIKSIENWLMVCLRLAGCCWAAFFSFLSFLHQIKLKIWIWLEEIEKKRKRQPIPPVNPKLFKFLDYGRGREALQPRKFNQSAHSKELNWNEFHFCWLGSGSELISFHQNIHKFMFFFHFNQFTLLL